MSLNEFLLSIPEIGKLSPRSKVLLVGYYLQKQGTTEFSVSELMDEFISGGLPRIEKAGDLLAEMARGNDPLLLPLGKREYSLSIYGLQEIENYIAKKTGISGAMPYLERVGKLPISDVEKEYLMETISCVSSESKRAAVVMCWSLTIARLHRFVFSKKLNDFNKTLVQRNAKSIPISTLDDFLDIKDEQEFISLLRSANIITNDIKKILETNLGFRNTCAHSNTTSIPNIKVIASIADLVDNVILRYNEDLRI